MEKLLAGVRRFRATEYANNQKFFEKLASRQQVPLALFITCSDSRVNPNMITQTEPGELFLVRNAGNLVPPYSAAVGGEAATIEYSIEVLGIRDIVLCGHSQCGAIQALLASERPDHLPVVSRWCEHAEAARRIVQQKYRHLAPAERAVAATQENVLLQINHLSTHPAAATRLATGELRIFGWYYDIGSGLVSQYDQTLGRFLPLAGEAAEAHPLATLTANGSTERTFRLQEASGHAQAE